MLQMQLATRPPSGGLCHGARGFTLVELVVVMLLMAVLASVGMSRFADREPFAVQGVADQLVSGLRLAQATAIAQRQTIHLVLGASPASLQVCLDSSCSQALDPPGGGPWLNDADGLQLAPATSFSFGASGAPSLTAALTVQVRNADGSVVSRNVQVEPVSGHVHQP
jgi:prepilin-type N-terminal cleavage/methylation domain-containing protein